MKQFRPLLLLILCTSCYRMPTEEDYATVPMTNNPTFTKEKNVTPIPKVGF